MFENARRLTTVKKLAASLALAAVPAVGIAASPARHAEASTNASASVVNTLKSRYDASSATRVKAARVAIAQLGDPYVWGASGPSSFDCSGLTSYAYKQAGKSIPRTSTAQRGFTTTVGTKAVGNLLFYSGHVAMYAGNVNGQDYVIEAQQTGVPVHVVPMRTSGLIKVGRVV